VKLLVKEDEAWSRTGGGGNRCGVARPMLRLPFIPLGRCEVAHQEIESSGGSPASMQFAFTAIANSG
jgi:hypothetical protein